MHYHTDSLILAPRRLALGMGAALLASLATLSSASAQSAGADWAHIHQVRALLAGEDSEEAAVRLERLGAAAAPAIWAILSGQDPSSEELDIGAAERSWLRSVLRIWPSSDVVAELLAAVVEDTPTNARLDLMRLLAEQRGPAATRGVLAILREIDPVHLQSSRVQAAVKAALGDCLTGPDASFRTIREQLTEMPRACLPALAGALGASDSYGATDLMLRLTRMDSSLEIQVLQQVAGSQHRLLRDGGRPFIAMARARLSSDQTIDRRIAVVSLGQLRDAGSFLDLADALEDSDPVVQRYAQAALQTTSGLRSRWSAARWREWHQGELDWLDSIDARIYSLRHGEPYEASVTARELARHPLYVETVNEALAYGLDHTHPKVRAAAVDGLAKSGHSSALDPLVEAMHDQDADVRARAQRGLIAITGTDLGSTGEPWSSWWEDLR